MQKPKILIWSDFVIDTGFGVVAKNLFSDLYLDYDVSILAINYTGDKRYDTSKYFVYSVTREDMLGLHRIEKILKDVKPDIFLMFQDIFHISELLPRIEKTLTAQKTKVMVYFPIDGAPFSAAWKNVLERADTIFIYSNWARTVIQDALPGLTKQMIKLYHGVNFDTFYPLSPDLIKETRKEFKWDKRFVVCNVNRFQPRKAIPLTLRAWSMFAKGYKICKCGNRMPLNKNRCDLNMCSPSDIIETVMLPKEDVTLYLHMLSQEFSMGIGRANLLQNHALNSGFDDKDIKNGILAINANKIYNEQIPQSEVNKIYNASNINITSTLGEGKLLEGTLICTKDGYKYIEEITNEDYVINDKGVFVNVQKTLSTKFTETMYSIRLSKFTEPIVCSRDHPFLLKNGTYKRADKLQLTDILAFRRPKFDIETPKKLDLANYVVSDNYKIEQNSLVSKKTADKKRMVRYIPINKDTCKFFGLYIAEGSASPTGLTFSFHNKEKDLHDFVINTYQKYINIFKDYKKPVFKESNKDNSGNIILSGAVLSRTFKKMFGTNAHTKEFPLYFLSLTKSQKRALLEGLIVGDGDISLLRHYTRYKTVSQKLAYLVRDMCLTLDKVTSVNKEDNSDGFGNGCIYSIRYYEDQKAKKSLGYLMPKFELNKEFVYLNLLSISQINPRGMGYDLEVPEGESYTIAQTTVHNCGLSLLEAAAVGTPSIAPKNSAIPEMLRDTGHLIPNVAVFNQALDNAHWRPLVDVWKMVEALEIEYARWKQTDGEKELRIECIKNVQENFRWDDKRKILRAEITKLLK